MSNYGNPPSDPDGQDPQVPPGGQPQNPYGQPPAQGGQPQNPYGQPPAEGGYGQNPYGAQPDGMAGGGAYGANYAVWGKRAAAYLIDGLLNGAASFLYIVGLVMAGNGASTTYDATTGTYTTSGGGGGFSTILILLGALMGLAFFIWNYCIKQGNTGYTIGKGVMGIKLVKAETGQPIGAGMSFVRYLAHIVDAIPCYIGYFWPLWDAKRQTFADKIVGTYVIDQPKV